MPPPSTHPQQQPLLTAGDLRLSPPIPCTHLPWLQVVSDFGFGRARKRAELFVGAFEPTYYLQRVRILGDDVRVLCCYPSQWQVGGLGTIWGVGCGVGVGGGRCPSAALHGRPVQGGGQGARGAAPMWPSWCAGGVELALHAGISAVPVHNGLEATAPRLPPFIASYGRSHSKPCAGLWPSFARGCPASAPPQ